MDPAVIFTMNDIPRSTVSIDTKRTCNMTDKMEAVGWILRSSSRS
jgi:hypothetical protein